MVAYPGRLPSRFPEGTKYVVEGKGGIFTRYIEFPDGSQLKLPAHAAAKKPATRSRRVRRSAARRG